MIKSRYGILSFESTHRAIFSEKILKKELDVETIPTPREISSECGISIKFEIDDYERVRELINENQLKIDGCYEILRTGSKKQIKELK